MTSKDSRALDEVILRSSYRGGWCSMDISAKNTRRLPFSSQHFGICRKANSEWVDLSLAREWNRRCLAEHEGCRKSHDLPYNIVTTPRWLVDVHRSCLVPGTSNRAYVALSYTWGSDTAAFLTTSTANLGKLQTEGSISRQAGLLCPSIKAALHITKALEFQYLWVDRLCIEQDNDVSRTHEIEAMAGIYAGASITLVAANADIWEDEIAIRGIRGVSPPRTFKQRHFEIAEQLLMFPMAHRTRDTNKMRYFHRGWTYQEEQFSSRRLLFVDNIMSWKCRQTEWFEDELYESRSPLTDPPSWQLGELSDIKPSQSDLYSLLSEFNSRELTFLQDVLRACAGLLSVLSQSAYPGGFISGHPRDIFDISLLWTPHQRPGPTTLTNEDIQRRPLGSNGSDQVYFPSLSWTGWKTRLNKYNMLTFGDHVRSDASDYCHNFEPTAKWSSSRDGITPYQSITCCWTEWRDSYMDSDTVYPPAGWTRLKNPGESGSEGGGESELAGQRKHEDQWPRTRAPKWIYRHSSGSGQDYYYPIPHCQLPSDFNKEPPNVFVQYLRCTTWRGHLAIDREKNGVSLFAFLRTKDGEWAGTLLLHQPRSFKTMLGPASSSSYTAELVEVGRGTERYFNAWPYVYHELPYTGAPSDIRFDPKMPYEFIHVLSVDGIAYRTGIGRVWKPVWEAMEKDRIEVTLG